MFATEECILREGGVLCPGAGCGMGLFLEPGMGPVVRCTSCNVSGNDSKSSAI